MSDEHQKCKKTSSKKKGKEVSFTLRRAESQFAGDEPRGRVNFSRQSGPESNIRRLKPLSPVLQPFVHSEQREQWTGQ